MPYCVVCTSSALSTSPGEAPAGPPGRRPTSLPCRPSRRDRAGGARRGPSGGGQLARPGARTVSAEARFSPPCPGTTGRSSSRRGDGARVHHRRTSLCRPSGTWKTDNEQKTTKSHFIEVRLPSTPSTSELPPALSRVLKRHNPRVRGSSQL